VFVFAAMLPWTFFATAFTSAGNSLIGNANLISKVYFPRLIIPAASIIVAVVDFLISFGILSLIVEYLVKPKLVGDRVKIHILLIFISIFGGLATFGLLGIIFGPLVTIAFLSLVEIYHQSYGKQLF